MGIGIWELVVLLMIVVVLFGTKKLGSVGGDLGSAIRGFRKALNEDDQSDAKPTATTDTNAVTRKDD